MEAVGLELTTDIDPPVDASVEVLFLKDCGEILSDDGEPIKLEKNAAMYIKRRLVENFIKDGSAQLMSSNSSWSRINKFLCDLYFTLCNIISEWNIFNHDLLGQP